MDLAQFRGRDNLEKFAQAMAWLRAHPHEELVIPPGVYEVTEPAAHAVFADMIRGALGENPQEKMFRADFPYRRVLDFEGQEGTRVIADGATLLLDGFFEPVSLRRCRGVTLRGLTVDYKRKPYSHGTIERIEGGELFVRFRQAMPDTFCSPRCALYRQTTGVMHFVPFGLGNKRRVEGELFAIGADHADRASVGDELYVWHAFHSRPAVCIQNAEEIVLKDVTVHAQPGMGIVGHLSRNITLDGVSVVPSAGERMSVNTDATHFASCYGKLTLTGCTFDGHGDDAMNVHNYDHAVTPLSGTRCRLRCLAPDGTHTQAADVPFAGDELQLVRRGTLDKGERFRVLAAKECADGSCEVTLDRPLPDGAEESYYLENASACPDFLFSHCRARNHFARSVLIKTHRARVEHCLFEHTDCAAVVVAAEEWWAEGTSSENVEIVGNVFWECAVRDHMASVVLVYTGSEEGTGRQHKRVVIRDNVVVCEKGVPAFSVKNVQETVTENNVIVEQ